MFERDAFAGFPTSVREEDHPQPATSIFDHKMTAEITRKSTNESLIVTDLSIHLLEEHHFIEGKGSQFRLEPQLMKRVLFD